MHGREGWRSLGAKIDVKAAFGRRWPLLI